MSEVVERERKFIYEPAWVKHTDNIGLQIRRCRPVFFMLFSPFYCTESMIF